MISHFPGTRMEVIPSQQGVKDIASNIIGNIFTAGGLVLSQVCSLTGLEYYIIQNWVKRGFLAPPVKKMYSKRQFCRIVIINALKDTMQIDQIVKMLSYINGALDDESDDLVDDSDLYNYFVNVMFADDGKTSPETIVENAITSYVEPIEGAKERLKKVLLVMYYAGLAAKNIRKSEELLGELD